MDSLTKNNETRRDFVFKTGALLGSAALMTPVKLLGAEERVMEGVDVTPTEDLMQEHGVLRRILFIFDDLGGRLKRGAEFPLAVLVEVLDILRRFIEDYHEKDEEEYLFPRFERAGKMVDLVKLLYQQHQAGRKMTAHLQKLLTPASLRKAEARSQAAEYLYLFTRMYRPHAAREDTVLYPAFRSIISPKEFMALGEKFEAKEEKLFGKDGYEKIVAKVAELEKPLGIYELSQFTPKI